MSDRALPIVVLIVEDDWIIRNAISEHFSEAGWRVVQAESGERAHEICGAGTHIDVVFTDVNLGGRATGWDIGFAFHDRSQTPVVYTSGNPDRIGNRIEGSLFFAKPYLHADIFAACAGLCSAEGARAVRRS